MKADVTYVNAVCIARHKTLIPWDKLCRLAEAPTYSAARSMLGEMGLDGTIPATQLLFEQEQELVAFLKEYAREPLLAFALSAYDAHNAEAAVRAHILLKEPVFTHEGNVSTVAIRKAVEGQKAHIPMWLQASITAALALHEAGKANGISLSTLFMRAYYAQLLTACRRSPAIKRILLSEIDAKNSSVCLRSASYDEAAGMLINGGTLSAEVLAALAEKDATRVAALLYGHPYLPWVTEAMAAQGAGKPLIALEQMAGSEALRLVAPHRYDSEGMYPLLFYYLYRKAELANLRIILLGKEAGASVSEIRARLRDGYGK